MVGAISTISTEPMGWFFFILGPDTRKIHLYPGLSGEKPILGCDYHKKKLQYERYGFVDWKHMPKDNYSSETIPYSLS